MKTLELQVPEDVASRIEKAANEQGVSVTRFLQVSIEEKLAREDALNIAAQTVLTKNAELYKRLA